MNEFDLSDIDRYSTFEDFFIRHHRRGSRPIYKEGDDSKAVVAADSRLVVYDSVEQSKRI